MKRELVRQLAAIVGDGQVATAPEELAAYSYDGSVREFPPAAVVFPRDREQIAPILRLASATGTPVTPRGAGTGMAGGACAVKGGIVLALAGLNKIVEIDSANQLVVVQPGVITAELQAEVARHGLYYPPDPASRAFCTIGGNVACGAGGPAAVKYGVTRDYVLALEAVLADGRVIRSGVRTAKGVVGYDLTRLLVGSEGTLAVISEITLRLIPQPPAKATFLALCRDMHQAVNLVNTILHQLTPCTLEYLDHTALGLVGDRLPAALKNQGRNALLLLELDGDRETVAAQGQRLRTLLAGQEGVALREAADPGETAELWAARKALSPAAFQLRPHKISEDVVVPRSRIPDLVAHIEELSRLHHLPVFTFGHAGDGNIHVNIMLDRNDPDELAQGEAARASLYRRVLALGGTLSGEHGVGIGKAAAIEAELGRETLQLMRELKKVFDPGNILNPGKIFV
ncbi:FAD-binding oxidoreductase [Desulfurivibrio sp. D14AmB]|uniref:FAD-binding oxidoreductase n=1 Tax=Desulfurivibrio sp. D14AmB TaxID=3374370 RepID=UPI00376F3E80